MSDFRFPPTRNDDRTMADRKEQILRECIVVSNLALLLFDAVQNGDITPEVNKKSEHLRHAAANLSNDVFLARRMRERSLMWDHYVKGFKR